MRRATSVISLCVLFLIAGVGSAGAACKPVVGHFEASVVPPGEGHCPAVAGAFCTAGRVWGGIQGNYQFVMSGAIPAATIGGTPSVLFFAGTSTVHLKSGAVVIGTDTGSIDLPPGQGGFASLITFGPGSQIRLRGEFSAQEGTTSGDYLGTMCD